MFTSPKQVLIVEDSADMQDLLKLILESKGYKTNCTSNGEEALAALNSGNPLPDVILLDLRMPIMDGYEFITRQRQIPKFKNIPVIVMSGDDDSKLTRSQANLENVLHKPLNMNSVIEAVGRNTLLH